MNSYVLDARVHLGLGHIKVAAPVMPDIGGAPSAPPTGTITGPKLPAPAGGTPITVDPKGAGGPSIPEVPGSLPPPGQPGPMTTTAPPLPPQGGGEQPQQPGILDQIGQGAKDLHAWGMGGEGQGYGEAWKQLTDMNGPGSTLQNALGNIPRAWNALPGYGKLGLGAAGAAGTGLLLNQLLGRRKKKPAAEMEVAASARVKTARELAWDKLKNQHGFGPGDGGPKHKGSAGPRKGSFKPKGSKSGPCCKPKGSKCGVGCSMPKAASFGVQLALVTR